MATASTLHWKYDTIHHGSASVETAIGTHRGYKIEARRWSGTRDSRPKVDIWHGSSFIRSFDLGPDNTIQDACRKAEDWIDQQKGR